MRTSDQHRSFKIGAILTSLCDLVGSLALVALLALDSEYLAPSGFVFGLIFIVTSGVLIYGAPGESSSVLLFWITLKVKQGCLMEPNSIFCFFRGNLATLNSLRL